MEETLTVDKQGSNLKSRMAYAFGNVGQSAFYNALSTYFIVYVTSSLFAGVDKGIATKLIGIITSLVVIIRIAEIFIDPLLGNIIDNTNTKWGRFKPWQLIGTLSKGMKMKYALALALSHKSELLIMDEPTSGLDPLIRSQLLGILTDYMNDGGKGVFFSTHITSDLDKIADMLIMIDNGHIVFQEEKDTLLDSYRIVKGDIRYLNTDSRKLFLSTTETTFGFSGITNKISEVQQLIPDLVIECPTIEDIMLGSIEGGKK